MSEERNKATCVRFFTEVHGRGNFAVLDEVVAAGVVSHSPWPGQKPGAVGVKETLAHFRRALPDMNVAIQHLIADGDMVVAYCTVTGTHRGSLMDEPPSGAKVSYEEAIVFRFQDGKIVEHWAVADALALLRQIRAVPE